MPSHGKNRLNGRRGSSASNRCGTISIWIELGRNAIARAIRDWTYTWHPATIAGLGDGESQCAWMTCRKAATSKIAAATAAAFGGGGGMGGMPIGTGGLGIGGMVVLGLIGWALGIDPFMLINGANVVIGGNQGGYEQTSAPPAAGAARRTGTPSDEAGRFVARVLGSTEVQWKDIFAKEGQTYRAPKLVMFSGADALGLRHRAERDGAVLLPERSRGLSRHRVLPRARDALPRLLRQGLRFLQGLRDRARGRPPRAEPARHPAQGAAGAARLRRPRAVQSPAGAGRAAGRLFRRRLGQPRRGAIQIPRSGRHRRRVADSVRDRRRHPAAESRRDKWCRKASPTAAAEQRKRWFSTGFKEGTIKACNTFAAASRL